MVLSGFHPVVARWFTDTFGVPTEAQAKGWPSIREGNHTLIAAPTGSGKTLAAFLVALNGLFEKGLAQGTLQNETTVVYVSPLKALSTDIHINLGMPREGIRATALAEGLTPPLITTAIRTGDTSPYRRAAMTRKPPHILVTTPESLYLLLTAERSRQILRTARCVIIDEIHAVLPSRRGAHLALSLERLNHVAGKPLQRIGLSATQRPVEEVARFLVGSSSKDCSIVDLGHRRNMDLQLELPASPLDAIIAHEVWAEIYDRLVKLAGAHRTTLVFVNARRTAERLAGQLAERLDSKVIAAHHGSLSQEKRKDAEQRLKEGQLKVLVATSSLELGIDIGEVDLVCQIGSPRSIATLLQRVGRAGHHIHGIPKGRLFPLTRDDLLECAALTVALERGDLESVYPLDMPLDVLAQQIVAEAAAEEWNMGPLTDMLRRAYPYRHLSRSTLDTIIHMLSRGFVTERGRRGALLYHDSIHQRIRGRPGARLVALTSGGAIPDTADYRVVLEPEQTFVGTVDEDFAVESIAGDIFQLGNASWRIQRLDAGVVRVEDAQGAPPTIPFWFGEASARSDELSAAVGRLRAEVEPHLHSPKAAQAWMQESYGLPSAAAQQLATYLASSWKLLGALPTQNTIIIERFFDNSGGMQLVIHAPLGARVNRAWGLALRKKFCRTFNFELQAAATENAILLSLGPQHSFPLADVFGYVQPTNLRETLIQAILDAPMFQTRWRWNLNIALAVPRRRGGRKVPPPLQRMIAEDILVAIFPEAVACLENIVGEREVPKHPLLDQTLTDCLETVMDYARLETVLARIQDGTIRCLTCDASEPSPLAHEILTASPYAFLDDAPLEERRTQAVHRRRAFEPTSANALGALDSAAIQRVCDEVRPTPSDADALHDTMLTTGGILTGKARDWNDLCQALAASGRATRGMLPGTEFAIWLPTERLHEGLSLWDLQLDPPLQPLEEPIEREKAAIAFVRGLLHTSGPLTQHQVAERLALPASLTKQTLLRLESSGEILRGAFRPGIAEREWCNRRLLARMHRYTLGRLRAEIQPVSSADYMRFLFAWQKTLPDYRVSGIEGLFSVVEQLDGYSLQAAAWEPDVLSLRVKDYSPGMLDTLCFTGRVGWARLGSRSTNEASPPIRSTAIALFLHEHSPLFLTPPITGAVLSADAQRILHVLQTYGASFTQSLVRESGLLPTQVETALGELVGRGMISADGFAGLRVLLTPSNERRRRKRPRHRSREAQFGMETAGRWFLVQTKEQEKDTEEIARTLLRRYGIVFRKLLARERGLPPWRELVRVYWRLEARGDIRGGRFVAGVHGEHFGLPEAVGLLRKVRNNEQIAAEPPSISAADPLNLTGIITPGARIPQLASNRVLYRKGIPVASSAGNNVTLHKETNDVHGWEKALLQQPESNALRAYLGHASSRISRWDKKSS